MDGNRASKDDSAQTGTGKHTHTPSAALVAVERNLGGALLSQ